MTIRGAVSARPEAVLRLRVRGPAGAVAEFDAVIDTGYTGLLTLPTAAAEALGLERGMGGQATLADGSARRFDTFAAELEWDAGWRSVVVSALGDEVLVGMRLLAGHELRLQAGGARGPGAGGGMRLLAGHELRLQVSPGGTVEVTALPPP